MAKTGKQIQGDIYSLILKSEISTEISGSVYRNGYRPRDSPREDIIVTFTAGQPGQEQTGIVTVNIYVPDIDPDSNGTYVEDGQRTEQLEILAQKWIDSMNAATMPPYRFKLKNTIYTEAEPDIKQHFVVVRLEYHYINETI